MKYILFFTTFFIAQTAFACSFGPDSNIFKTQEENYSNYSHILSVTITNREEINKFEGSEYTFTVHESHKGEAESTMVVFSPGHSCGFFGEVGSSFLWFTNGTEEIDETTPKYNYETSFEATEAGNILVGPTGQQPCTKDYRPVCAAVQVQCITTPCPPIEETYGNSCMAENANAEIVHEGECVVGSEIEPTGPQATPGESFTPPTTPPPYDNSPQLPEETPESSTWFKIASFFTKWFAWW